MRARWIRERVIAGEYPIEQGIAVTGSDDAQLLVEEDMEAACSLLIASHFFRSVRARRSFDFQFTVFWSPVPRYGTPRDKPG